MGFKSSDWVTLTQKVIPFIASYAALTYYCSGVSSISSGSSTWAFSLLTSAATIIFSGSGTSYLKFEALNGELTSNGYTYYVTLEYW